MATLFSVINKDSIFDTYTALFNLYPIFSRLYIYIMVLIFTYVGLNIFIFIVHDAYDSANEVINFKLVEFY